MVAVDVAMRCDKEMQANADMIKLPVVILNHGNTVKFTDYSFLANVFAARGYLAISIPRGERREVALRPARHLTWRDGTLLA